MLRFVAKRLVLMIPILLGINLLIFTIMFLSPNDPAVLILGQNATEEAADQWREEHGLNDSFLEQYFNNLKDLITGNFGNSYVSGRPVMQDFAQRFPVSLTFAITGMKRTTQPGGA